MHSAHPAFSNSLASLSHSYQTPSSGMEVTLEASLPFQLWERKHTKKHTKCCTDAKGVTYLCLFSCLSWKLLPSASHWNMAGIILFFLCKDLYPNLHQHHDSVSIIFLLLYFFLETVLSVDNVIQQ